MVVVVGPPLACFAGVLVVVVVVVVVVFALPFPPLLDPSWHPN